MSTKIIQTMRPLSKAGTELPVGGRTYHFTPNARGDYIAEVVDKDVPTVLSISAGYQLYPYQNEPMLPGGAIVTPEPVREPAARASPPPPLARGEHRPTNTAFGNKNKAKTTTATPAE